MTENNLKAENKPAKKKKKWCKTRHKVVTFLLRDAFHLYIRIVYGIRIEKCPDRRQYLILMNHQTAFDQFFVGLAFPKPLYYVASEDLFSKGFVSSLIKWLVAPIPIKKSTSDSHAVRLCRKVALEGGSIALFPEGNRTFSGKTEYIKPSLEQLVRFLRLPVAILNLEGGFGVHPRWSDVIRKGKCRVRFKRIIEVEEYKAMPEGELAKLLEKELYVDDTAIPAEYHHKNSAEYLERVMYFCPDCHLSEWETHGDTATCKTCGKQVRYRPDLRLEGVGTPFPFSTLSEWYDAQSEFINDLDLSLYNERPAYMDEIQFSEVILYKNKVLLAEKATFSLYGDRYTVTTENETLTFCFKDITTVSVLGKNKLNFYTGDKVYQIKGSTRFNAVKYMHFYFRYTHILKGELYDKFLGL
ncbi:MAG: 1-acyl-sn-glycerol-3-phosphate acyltransferase [Clostridia bacterium]|nr:1-acyl-sn-glycerol-3-phosphate acyltransferase [Clostridia bacterium]